MERISITCLSITAAYDRVNELFDTKPDLKKLYVIHDTRPSEEAFYVLTYLGIVRGFERVIEINRPEKHLITPTAAKPLINTICRRQGLTWGRDAKRLIDLSNEAINRCTYIAVHMITRSGDNSEYIPGLIHLYIPRYIAKCIEKN